MECLDYVKYQVSLKREELVQLEKDLLISKKQFKEADTENMPMPINYQWLIAIKDSLFPSLHVEW